MEWPQPQKRPQPMGGAHPRDGRNRPGSGEPKSAGVGPHVLGSAAETSGSSPSVAGLCARASPQTVGCQGHGPHWATIQRPRVLGSEALRPWVLGLRRGPSSPRATLSTNNMCWRPQRLGPILRTISTLNLGICVVAECVCLVEAESEATSASSYLGGSSLGGAILRLKGQATCRVERCPAIRGLSLGRIAGAMRL